MTRTLAVSTKFQKTIIVFMVSFAFLMALAAMPAPAQALTLMHCSAGAPCPTPSGLTEAQVSAVISLLTAFGADQTTLQKIEAALGGTTASANPRPSSPGLSATPITGQAPLTVKFTSPVGNGINFGDGTPEEVFSYCLSTECRAEGFEIEHTYTKAGSYMPRALNCCYNSKVYGPIITVSDPSQNTTGIRAAFVSASAENMLAATATAPGLAEFKIVFDVTVQGGDAYIDRSATYDADSNGKNALGDGFLFAPTPDSNIGITTAYAVTANTSDVADTSVLYKIGAGQTRRFTFTSIASIPADKSGHVAMRLTGINWGTPKNSLSPVSVKADKWYNENLSDFKTGTLSFGPSSLVSQICGTVINPQSMFHDAGNGYLVHGIAPHGDLSEGKHQSQSTLQLFENNKLLGPAHTLHADIRAQGNGRYSHWYNNLFFSASDNTDPRTNGRTYTYGGVACPNPPASQGSAGQGALVLGAQSSPQSGVSEAQIQSILQQLQAAGANQSLINQIIGVLRGQSPAGTGNQSSGNSQPGVYTPANSPYVGGPAGLISNNVSFEAHPRAGTPPLTVKFTSAVGTEINFGDGSSEQFSYCQSTDCPNEGFSIEHIYSSVGTYTATVSKYVPCTAPVGAACAQAPINVVASTTITVASSTQNGTSRNVGTAPVACGSGAGIICQNNDRPLLFGRRGEDVKSLQAFLAKDKEVYPAGIVSGYYGRQTEEAVKKYQVKHGIVSSGSPATTGWGVVGPKTRAWIAGQSGVNSGVNNGSSTNNQIGPGQAGMLKR